MIYTYNKSKIEGVYELFPTTFKDQRGSISKIYHRESFLELSLNCNFTETLVTTNFNSGIIRGFHLQTEPFFQNKTLFAATGSFLNIVLDLRNNSKMYGEFDIFEVNSATANIIYVPEGVANCYCILEKNTIIVYNLTGTYSPTHAKGVRYDSINFEYPFSEPVLSEKDLALPYLKDF